MKNISRTLVGAALCADLAAAGARAQPAAATMPESVIVTGTRLSDGIPAAASNADMLGPAQIESRHAGSVMDLLRAFPDVFVQQAGGRGGVVSLFTRGAKPNFTLVLMDGVKVNDPTNTRGGSYDFSSLDLNGIDRIEFVRGPSSAIYGSDAMGGVINIISRRGTQIPQASVTLEGGSYGFVRAAGRVEGPVGGASGSLGLAYNDDGSPTPGNSLHGASVDGALALPDLAGISVSLTGRYGTSQSTSFPDSSGGPRLAVLRTLDRRNIDEGVFGAHAERTISSLWSMTLDYGLYDRAARAVSPGVAPSAQTPFGIPPNSDTVHFVRNQVTWTNHLAPLPGLEIAGGLDLQLEHGVDDGTLKFGPVPTPTHFALDRTTGSAFTEARYQIAPGFDLSASLRFDQASDGTGHLSPQLRANYRLARTGTLFQLSWAQAYKRPSFYALGNPIVGDPGLKPESADSFEAGVTQPLGGFGRWKFGAFDTQYSDLIDFRPGAIPKLVNLSTVRARGVETSLEVSWGDVTVSPHVSYTDARNTITGAALRDVPGWLAGAALLWQPDPKLTISADLSQVGPLVDNSVPTGDVKLRGHARVNMAASYQISGGLKLFAAIDNLLATRKESVVGFPDPGLVARAGIAATF